ncbi:hypothetical protein ACFPRL_19135 [Pseudoclavibacter helvolus]
MTGSLRGCHRRPSWRGRRPGRQHPSRRNRCRNRHRRRCPASRSARSSPCRRLRWAAGSARPCPWALALRCSRPRCSA